MLANMAYQKSALRTIYIRDKSVLQRVLSHLSNNKTPGPDEIPNELLKHLPASMQDAIHQLFILMWMTSTTPDAWKQSETILLHKKNDETLLENYRPIALANTMYKLWTGLIQECLNTYADHYNILSNSQEGFRKYRNTMRQLHTLVNVLSDAKLSEQNLFMLYIDFSSAFNTIDHDKLLQIMYDLGFPTDAINVIEDLYTDATTQVKLPMGKTDAIHINRGTIQGDSLSPFLFLIFMEPLLRWLQSGGRGYRYGCLRRSTAGDHTTSAMAYADDLLAVSSNINDLVKQTHKIEAFTTRAGMKVNCKKCGVSGMLYNYVKSGLLDSTLNTKAVQMLDRKLAQITIDGERVPFHHPDKDPYTYLGVDVTPTLNWSFQLKKTIDTVKERGIRMASCMLTYRQKLHFVRTVILPAATYAFPLAYLTPADLAKLDRLYSRICKQAMGLPTCTPTAMLFEDRQKGGMGMPSLEVDYADMVTRSLTLSLLDDGQLGTVSQALLYLQNSIVGSVAENGQTKQALKHVKHYHLARKLAILQASGMGLSFPRNMRTPEGNMLAEQIAKIRQSGEDLGMGTIIPADICMPLLQLGYDSFADLLCRQRNPALISTTDLCQIHGHRVKRGHKLALNRLTVLLNEQDFSKLTVKKAKAHSSVAAIDIALRTVNNPVFTELCSQEHPGMRAVRNQERSAFAPDPRA